MAKLLTQSEIDSALTTLDGWTQEGDSIVRSFKLPSFPAALVFANAVGHLAEQADHHPDMVIQYRDVQLTLATHSAGGLTKKDFELAARIDSIA